MKRSRKLFVLLLMSCMLYCCVFTSSATEVQPEVFTPTLSTVTSQPTTIIGEGTYLVGADIVAGTYMLLANGKYSAYYSINTTSGSDSEIISNDNFSYNQIISVSDGQYLEIKRCTLSPLTEIPLLDCTQANRYLVGFNLPAGEYKIVSNSTYTSYYSITSDANEDDILKNDNFNGQAYVTVKDGEYLKLNRCSIVF